jgi:CRP-like cAMP-binding protein
VSFVPPERPTRSDGTIPAHNEVMPQMQATADAEDFFARVGPDAAAALQALGTRRRYPAGAILFLEGDTAHEVLVVLEGDLKVLVGSASGREVVVEIAGPGSLIGEWAVIDGKPRSATVTAVSAVEVLTIGAADFRAFLADHPEALTGLLLDTIGRLRHQVRHQLEFGAGDAVGRVCARLVEMAERYGEADGTLTLIRSPLSQADLAAWTGLSREGVVKALRTLRQLGLIDNRGPDITVHDLEALRRRATH